MGCGNSSAASTNDTYATQNDCPTYTNDSRNKGDSIFSAKTASADDILLKKVVNIHDQVVSRPEDPEAFNSSLLKQRQQAIDNRNYRSTIESWKPKTLQQLGELIKSYGNGKSRLDCHWFIYYWITANIGYDTVAYFGGKYDHQSAEDVFQNRKGVCAGYANLYKHICDQLQLPCIIVGGYSKGYGFEYRKNPPSKTDHAWNIVEIDEHQYLVESTWGSGHLNESGAFERQLDPYYFLPRPEQMIYHHMPEKPKHQLLQNTVNLEEFMKMPHLRPLYFSYNLELISPRNQVHLSLLPGRPYALVLLRTPPNIYLMADLKFKEQTVENASHIRFDKQTQLYRCYFAPIRTGQHQIVIFARKGESQEGEYNSVLEFVLNAKELPKYSISFPKTWKLFYDYELEVISPQNTHLIQLNGTNNTEILIKAPEHIELICRLTDQKGQDIKNADRTTYDQNRKLWRCEFAPNREGIFEAIISAKKKSDSGSYTSAIAFKIDVKNLTTQKTTTTTTNLVSHPEFWPLFHELGLVIVEPKNSSHAVWSDDASYAQVLIQTPKHIQLSGQILFNGKIIENGSFTQFDHQRKLWQLLFAPERTGQHELVVFAQKMNDNSNSADSVVKFNLDVNKLKRPMKFPLVYTQFQSKKCQLYSPMDGTLKKGSTVEICCFVPGAIDVAISIDSKPAEPGGYSNSMFQKEVKVGSKNIIVCAQYNKNTGFDGLIQYNVQ